MMTAVTNIKFSPGALSRSGITSRAAHLDTADLLPLSVNTVPQMAR
jgi:hypothetical protein